MAIIQFKDVWEMYRIKFVIDGKNYWENFWALKGISFEIEKGETLGIIGENGAGKSTVLKLISGMLKPDRGEIKVQGKVSGLLELGAGFQPELTGRENIYLNASLFGLTQNRINEKYEEIVNFANLGKFINAPVKCYSQGMFVRLAFAIAIHMNPDVLLIDDTLAVGDEYFQRKCIKKIFDLKEQGLTIIFVTHDMNMLSRLCKRAISLKEGRIIKDGTIDKVIPHTNTYLKGLQYDSTLSDEKLKLTFDNGQGILSYDGKELTKGSHIGSAIYINGRWYHSWSAQWKVDKEGERKLVAYGIWHGLPIAQIWEIEALKENFFLWKVKLLVNEAVDIEEQYVDFMCSKDYTHWFCDYGQGVCPNEFLEVTTDMLQKCIPDGIVGLYGYDIRLPAIYLKFSKELNNFAKILNSDFYNKARILHINKVEPEEKVRFVPGEYPSFTIEFILDEEKKDSSIHILPNILEDGRLRFIFERGRGRIYWDGAELTKRLGVYTSLRSAGRWYDSVTGALWKTEEKDEKTIKAEGKWLHLPISQYWQFNLKHNFIEFDVKMKIKEKIEIDRLQTNIMLSEKYLGWITEKNEGRFPFFKDDVNDDWDCIYSPGDGSRYIGVAGNITDKISLPQVLLLPRALNPDWSLNIINSDIYHRGRVLQYLSAKKTQVSPGEYPYFSGRISVEV